jgi:hypothetical protein
MKAGNASPANTILFGPVRRGNSFYHCSMQRKFREGCRSRILAVVLATSRPPPQRAVQSRTAGLLARQTPARLQAIQSAIEESVRLYAKGDGFAIPKATYVIAVGNKVRMEKEEERKQRAAA